MSSLYTLAVWVTQADGSRVREWVDTEWRAPYLDMEKRACELTVASQYQSHKYAVLERVYEAVPVSQIDKKKER